MTDFSSFLFLLFLLLFLLLLLLLFLQNTRWYLEEGDKRPEAFPVGAFYVRRSNSQKAGDFALICRSVVGRHKIAIKSSANGEFYLVKSRKFPSLPTLIEYYMQHPLKDDVEAVPTPLITPLGTRDFPEDAGAAERANLSPAPAQGMEKQLSNLSADFIETSDVV